MCGRGSSPLRALTIAAVLVLVVGGAGARAHAVPAPVPTSDCPDPNALGAGLAAAQTCYDGHPRPAWIPTGVYAPFGVTLGVGLHGDSVDDGLVLGLEQSLVTFLDDEASYWLGAYVDAVRDFGSDNFRFSIGPEGGYKFFGFDGGYVLAVDDDGHVAHGLTGRFVLTAAFVALYGRVGYLFDVPGAEPWVEIGFLFKFPIPVDS